MHTRLRYLVASSSFVAAILASTSGYCATWQVGPTRAAKTIADVMSKLAPGDVILLDGGTTYAGDVSLQTAGTKDEPITLHGVPVSGKRPVISGGTNGVEVSADHWVVEGVELTASSSRCFFHAADDVTLRDSVIHDCPTHGLLGADAGSGSLLLEYVEVYKCGGGDRHHQVYMATDETAHPGSVFRMQHCFVHDANGGHSVKSRAERNEIYDNWIEGALYQELELIGPDGQAENLAREDSDVVGNVLVKTRAGTIARFGGDGTGQTNGRYRFVSNTVVALPDSTVLRLFDGVESVDASDNVIWASGGAPRILTDADAVWSTGARLVFGTNNWLQSNATYVPEDCAHSVVGNAPGFVDFASLALAPAAASPMIDAGLSNPPGVPGHPVPNPLVAAAYEPQRRLLPVGGAIPRPIWGKLDIGAFEWTPAGADAGVVDAGGQADAGAPDAPAADAGRDAGTDATDDVVVIPSPDSGDGAVGKQDGGVIADGGIAADAADDGAAGDARADAGRPLPPGPGTTCATAAPGTGDGARVAPALLLGALAALARRRRRAR